MDLLTKVCRGCGKELPATKDNFVVSKKGKYGLSSKCKQCECSLRESKRASKLEYDRRYREENRELLRQKARNYSNSSGRKEAKAKYDMEYRIENKDKIRDAKRRYYLENRELENERRKLSTNKRRASKKVSGGVFTVVDWEDCKKFFCNSCAYCGKAKKLEVEHFRSLSKGGTNSKENIVTACRECNSSKNNLDPFVWFPTREFFCEDRLDKITSYLGITDWEIR